MGVFDTAALGLPSMSILTWVLALLPIAVILVLMLGLNFSGGRSGIICWVLTAAIIYFVFGGGTDVIAAGTVKGMWSTLFVLFIIWSAMYMYNLVNITGAFEVIAAKFTEMTNGNKILQILILGWCFPTFVQGVCGFGVPVAVATPLLIGLGFDPIVACITTLLGHSWGVTFGSLGSSYSILVSQSPVDTIYPGLTAFWGSILIAFGGVIVGFCILHNYGARSMKNTAKAFKEGTFAVVFLSGVMGITMIATCLVSPYVGCFVAGAAGLIAGVLVLPRLKMYAPAEGADQGEKTSWSVFFKNFSAYLILIIVVFAVYLIAPVKSALEAPAFKLGLAFPENALAANAAGIVYSNAAVSKYSALKIFTTPGTLIVISSMLAALCYKTLGLLPKGAMGEAFKRTVQQSIGATTTIIPMTMMAVLMTEGGLTQYIAYGLAAVAGNFYPILAPFIGILGGFVTSSGTSSNILFTGLQYSAAEVLNISPAIILSEQTTGSSLSNSFSPGNCALGTGVSNQVGREGEILAATGVYNMIQGALVGILGYILITMGLGF